MKPHLLLALLSTVALAAPGAKTCADIATTALGAEVKIDSARMVPAAPNLREHCDIRGVIWPENKFVVKLPTNWNNRFLMPGNGGWAGVLSIGFVDQAVATGYAAASTDNGHDAQKEPGAIFALASATNPNATRKVIDHGYLSVHATVLSQRK
jgi:feruloyl esterase